MQQPNDRPTRAQRTHQLPDLFAPFNPLVKPADKRHLPLGLPVILVVQERSGDGDDVQRRQETIQDPRVG